MKKKQASPRSTSSIDKHFGEQIRSRRHAINMSQDHLGKELGVTFQQVQKYEAGVNRITAARLYEICQVFDVPIASMFDGIPRPAPRPAKRNGRAASGPRKSRRADPAA
jgi:transcriptional regulator with XRE-family HTH domain